jgi:hypothetical protein
VNAHLPYPLPRALPLNSTGVFALHPDTRHPARKSNHPARSTAQSSSWSSYSAINNVLHAAFLFSWPYTAAMAAGVTEYVLEAQWWPLLKQHQLLSYTGLALVIAGEVLRKLAMVSSPESNTQHFSTGQTCMQAQAQTTQCIRVQIMDPQSRPPPLESRLETLLRFMAPNQLLLVASLAALRSGTRLRHASFYHKL